MAMSLKYSKRENTVSRPASLLIHLFFITFAISCLLPVIFIFMVSITDEATLISKGYSLFPQKISWLAYEYLFKDSLTIIRAYGVTIFAGVAGTLLNVLITALFAYPLSRGQFPFKRFFSLLILLPMLFSGGLVSFYIIYVNYLSVKNSLFALILPGVFGGFNVFVMRTYFKSNIHESIVESAYIDGASELRIFARIILPLALPVLATIGFFSFIGFWNDWFNCALFITDERLYNIQYVMMKSLRDLSYLRTHWQEMGGYASAELSRIPTEGVRMAMAVVGMTPILVSFPFFQRFLIKGIVFGAVKG